MKKILLIATMACVIGMMTACFFFHTPPTPPKIDPNDTFVINVPEKNPEFPGGTDSLDAYLDRHVRYPQKALENGIEGKVYVQFIVEKDGSISDAKVLRDIVYGSDEADSLASELGCGAEVIRVLNLNTMPKWEPAVIHGYIRRCYYTIAFEFTQGKNYPTE